SQSVDDIRDRNVTGVQTCAHPILTVVYGFAPPARRQLLALHPVQGRIEAAERDPALAPGQGQDLVDDLKAIELLARDRRRDQDLRLAEPRHPHLFSP